MVRPAIDLSRIPTNNGAESRSGWTKIHQMYENVHPNLALVLLLVHTEVECGKGLLQYYCNCSFIFKCFFSNYLQLRSVNHSYPKLLTFTLVSKEPEATNSP